ncbi:MAG: 50S ribosomal protein L35 [Candidatus Pacebacteria bacterium]|nr:50S ribosomal protein L35 [Candidatus Paceibacterota bacterium]
MKTNKSLAKRLKVTRNGKVMARKPGHNHFNAKASRKSQLSAKRPATLAMGQRTRRRFLSGI